MLEDCDLLSKRSRSKLRSQSLFITNNPGMHAGNMVEFRNQKQRNLVPDPTGHLDGFLISPPKVAKRFSVSEPYGHFPPFGQISSRHAFREFESRVDRPGNLGSTHSFCPSSCLGIFIVILLSSREIYTIGRIMWSRKRFCFKNCHLVKLGHLKARLKWAAKLQVCRFQKILPLAKWTSASKILCCFKKSMQLSRSRNYPLQSS